MIFLFAPKSALVFSHLIPQLIAFVSSVPLILIFVNLFSWSRQIMCWCRPSWGFQHYVNHPFKTVANYMFCRHWQIHLTIVLPLEVIAKCA